MENYDWDLAQPSTFAELPDEDFLALLQKQFPPAGVNPQSLHLAGSEESSPSPPELKRKADDDEFEPGPSKPAAKKSAPAKRKSSGSPDESRLLKRKEQNRAAQRAFRERKEKHVKDLEDKVAALEAQNSQAMSENENLKDLLTRLQNENMALKRNSFTFTMPKQQSQQQAQQPQQQDQSFFTPTNALDLSSLNSFDPSVLNLLEDQQTATAASDSLAPNFGFSNTTDQSGFLGNFRTIASNPMFTSLSTYFDEPGPAPGVDFSALAEMQKSQQDVDFTSLTPWPSSTDDLFTATWGSPPSTTNMSPIVHSSSTSFPLTSSPVGMGLSDSFTRSSFSSGSGSGSSSSSADSPSNSSDHPSSTTSISSPPSMEQLHNKDTCPKTKGELSQRIAAEGPSLFTHSSAPTPNIGEFGAGLETMTAGTGRTPSMGGTGSPLGGGGGGGVTCSPESSHFPSTEKNERNVEITSAWRTITSDPNHKAVDINLLCTEFSSKARCDGSKVVIKPEGLEDIKRLLSEKAALAMV